MKATRPVRLTRRHFLKMTAAAGASLSVVPTGFGQASKPATSNGLSYKFVNKTNGKFPDDQCFWSLDGGRGWHSFAKEPSVACPVGNGRVCFRLGAAPRNFDDFEACWDFIEYTYGRGTWNGNTTQVDAFCIPLTIELGAKRLGISESRSKLFEAFRKEAPKEFTACVKGDYRILSPCRAGFNKGGPNGNYFDRYGSCYDDVSEQAAFFSGIGEKLTVSLYWDT